MATEQAAHFERFKVERQEREEAQRLRLEAIERVRRQEEQDERARQIVSRWRDISDAVSLVEAISKGDVTIGDQALDDLRAFVDRGP